MSRSLRVAGVVVALTALVACPDRPRPGATDHGGGGAATHVGPVQLVDGLATVDGAGLVDGAAGVDGAVATADAAGAAGDAAPAQSSRRRRRVDPDWPADYIGPCQRDTQCTLFAQCGCRCQPLLRSVSFGGSSCDKTCDRAPCAGATARCDQVNHTCVVE